MKAILPRRTTDPTETFVHGLMAAAAVIAAVTFLHAIIQVSGHRIEIARAFERWSTPTPTSLLAGATTNQTAPTSPAPASSPTAADPTCGAPNPPAPTDG